MYRALYRKYRPSAFRDVVGQEHIVTTLQNQLKNGKISHAYLFTGSRGTGKTSCAKILAKAVNCLQLQEGDACLQCESCRRIENEENFDIVEIDAASNNGVENIRNLREQVAYAPAQSKYRVYIIDEVHMLSSGAFNALLKTLEEPPSTVVFILATTEVHKMPATILSRCQRFDFHRIEPELIAGRLLKIADLEGLELEQDAAMLMAMMADGGMRDALSMLDVCAAKGGKITEQTVEDATAIAGHDALFRLVEAMQQGDIPAALRLIDIVYKGAVDIQHLCEQLLGAYRNLMILRSVPDAVALVPCPKAQLSRLQAIAEKYALEDIMMSIRQLSDALNRMNTSNCRSELEMAVIKICTPALSGETENILQRLAALEKGHSAPVATPVPKAVSEPPQTEPEPKAPVVQEKPKNPETPRTESPAAGQVENWAAVVRELGKTHPLLAGYLHASAAYVQGDFLLIDSQNTQFNDLIRQATYRDALRRAAENVLGKQYKLGPYKKKINEGASKDPLDEIMQKLETFEM
ncbi:MAG: DNA polymerase III subunit gamma/tau [Clostridia bacterium]|nr:DNA polymerase III subunit gamma/tau [Clostridia bacterium]